MENNCYITQMLIQLEPTIKRHSYSTELIHREDLMQELQLKIIEKIPNLLQEEPPTFWDFLEKIY